MKENLYIIFLADGRNLLDMLGAVSAVSEDVAERVWRACMADVGNLYIEKVEEHIVATAKDNEEKP